MSIVGELQTMAMCHGYERYVWATHHKHPPSDRACRCGLHESKSAQPELFDSIWTKSVRKGVIGIGSTWHVMYLHISGGDVLLDP